VKIFFCYLALLVVVASVIVFRHGNAKEPHKRACQGIEMDLQNAVQCLAMPHMWNEWSEIGKAYGKNPTEGLGTIGCPIFISKTKSYGLMKDDTGVFVNQLIEAYKDGPLESIRYAFKEETGQDFCKVAESRGWIAEYLKMNP